MVLGDYKRTRGRCLAKGAVGVAGVEKSIAFVRKATVPVRRTHTPVGEPSAIMAWHHRHDDFTFPLQRPWRSRGGWRSRCWGRH